MFRERRGAGVQGQIVASTPPQRGRPPKNSYLRQTGKSEMVVAAHRGRRNGTKTRRGLGCKLAHGRWERFRIVGIVSYEFRSTWTWGFWFGVDFSKCPGCRFAFLDETTKAKHLFRLLPDSFPAHDGWGIGTVGVEKRRESRVLSPAWHR